MNEQGSLQSLIEELNKEGIEKGRIEAEKILSKAKDEAKNILDEAKLKASEITKEAERQAQETDKSCKENLELAARDFAIQLKVSIENELFQPALAEQLKQTLTDKVLIKQVIYNISKSLLDQSQTKASIVLYLNRSDAETLGKEIGAEVADKLSTGVTIKPLPESEIGFKLGIEGDNFTWDFTLDGLIKVFTPYLLPRFRELLYRDKD